ncbi:MAG: carboxypeptidase regulatory-like domain-containing protein, partial [Acidobacteria bacterium]|nr:carboxypeptidase regulatory-like domain-containing protein [Acidobacteriota bacterium]
VFLAFWFQKEIRDNQPNPAMPLPDIASESQVNTQSKTVVEPEINPTLKGDSNRSAHGLDRVQDQATVFPNLEWTALCQTLNFETQEAMADVDVFVWVADDLIAQYRSDHDGFVQVPLPNPDKEITVWASRAEWVSKPQKIQVRSEEQIRRLYLQHGIPIEIAFEDADSGDPISGVRLVKINGWFPPLADETGIWRANLTPGDFGFWAFSPQHQNQFFHVSVQAGARYTLQLKKGWSLKGRIMDPQGQPIPDVSIRPQSFAHAFYSDANGQYCVSGLGLGFENFNLNRKGYRHFAKSFEITELDQTPIEMDWVLEPDDGHDPKAPYLIQGFVKDISGQALEGAFVSHPGGSLQTDSNGFFAFEDDSLWPKIEVAYKDYQLIDSGASSRQGGAFYHNFRMAPCFQVKGQVFNAWGRPIGAQISPIARIQSSFDEEPKPSSRFAVWVPKGTTHLTFKAPDHFPSRLGIPEKGEMIVHLEQRVIEIFLKDEQSNPVPDFEISLQGPNRGYKDGPIHVSSAQGRFEWRPESEYANWVLFASSGSQTTEPQTLSGDEVGPITLTLKPRGRLAGRVLEQGEREMANFPLRLSAYQRANPMDQPSQLEEQVSEQIISTDVEGRFVLENVSGTYYYQVESAHPDYLSKPLILGKPVPNPPERILSVIPATDLEVSLDFSAEEMPQSVAVRHESGFWQSKRVEGPTVFMRAPVGKASIWVYWQNIQEREEKAELLPNQLNRVSFKKKGFQLEVRATLNGLPVTPQTEWNNPLFFLDSKGLNQGKFLGNNRYLFMNLEPGPGLLRLARGPLQQHEMTVDLQADTEMEAAFTLWGELTGILSPPTPVYLSRFAPSYGRADLNPNASGHFSMQDVAPGSYKVHMGELDLLTFEKGEGPLDLGTIKIPANGGLQVELAGCQPDFAQLRCPAAKLSIPLDMGIAKPIPVGTYTFSLSATGFVTSPLEFEAEIQADSISTIRLTCRAVTQKLIRLPFMLSAVTAVFDADQSRLELPPIQWDFNSQQSGFNRNIIFLFDLHEGHWQFEALGTNGERRQFDLILSLNDHNQLQIP